MSDTQKQPFVEKAKADSERAAKDKEEYQKTLPPKRPLSAYILYSKEIRDSIVKAHPNASIGEQAKLMGEKWRNLSEAQKDKYRKVSEQARTEWKKQNEQE